MGTSWADGRIAIAMIDASLGHTIQEWQFEGKPVISIGRADERDVTIVDPYVSRLHVELQWRDDAWWVVALGRHGVLVEGRSVAEAPLIDGAQFRLGATGPILKLRQPTTETVSQLNLTTMAEIPAGLALELELDREQLGSEVREITEGDYFQQLKQRRDELRRRREE
jgi:pSer/pThr/pTyr-binding forkhead associated (FHA) protein